MPTVKTQCQKINGQQYAIAGMVNLNKILEQEHPEICYKTINLSSPSHLKGAILFLVTEKKHPRILEYVLEATVVNVLKK